jgi:hypothetical protein
MVADGSDGRYVQQGWGDEVGDKCQDHQIRIQLTIGLFNLGIFHFAGTKKGYSRAFGCCRHRLTPPIIRAKDTDDVFALTDQGVQYFLAKGTLANQDNAHDVYLTRMRSSAGRKNTADPTFIIQLAGRR